MWYQPIGIETFMHPSLEKVVNQLNQIILGKDQQIKLALVCLLAKGHLLIEDLPGMGKTTLAHALAKVLLCWWRGP